METVHTETEGPITYTLAIEQDDTPVRGYASASGNNAEDTETEDAILSRLDSGETWAWATVRVSASVTAEGETFEGTDYLGCCSYTDTAEFIAEGGYYTDMKSTAKDALLTRLQAASVALETLNG